MKKILLISISTLIITGCSFNSPTIPKEQVNNAEEVVIKEPEFNNGENIPDNTVTNEDLIVDNDSTKKLNKELDNMETSEYNPELKDIGISKIENVKIKPDNLSLSNLFYTIHFDFNQYKLEEKEKNKLRKLILFLKENENKIKNKQLVIEGNADQRGSDEYNYALGIKRAHYIKEQIIFNTTVLNKNIKIISYGETNTLCNDETPECYKLNRRVEIHLK